VFILSVFILAGPAASSHNHGRAHMHTQSWTVRRHLLALAFSTLTLHSVTAAENPFLGRWALTLPGGGAGWLEITREQGYYDGRILWGGGSVVPVSSVFFQDNALFVTRTRDVKRQDASGKTVRTQQFTEVIEARVDGDQLSLEQRNPRDNGSGCSEAKFSGKRIPPLPPRPDLAQVKFGDPIPLFNGRDLTGWRLVEASAVNGWSVQDGILINRPVQEEGKPHKHYGNLRTDREFEDFKLTLEVKVPRRQSLDITLVDRHLTVVLNGTTVIDNQPILGCTGGALWSDELRPGPIYFQGDHEAVDYRDVVLRPVVR